MPEEQNCTLLVIDDDPTIVDVMGRYFRKTGFRSYTFTDPQDALKWYHHHAHEVDFVFLDLKMPGLSGAECFEKIRRLRPNQAVALMSGFSDDLAVETLLSSGAKTFFQKPFELSNIVEWIRISRNESGKRTWDTPAF